MPSVEHNVKIQPGQKSKGGKVTTNNKEEYKGMMSKDAMAYAKEKVRQWDHHKKGEWKIGMRRKDTL